MNLEDIKLYFFNASAMVVSFTNVERTLKIFLLCASIVYTILKIIELKKNRKDETN